MSFSLSDIDTWVGLENVQVHAFHGVHQAERILGTTFIVDLKARLSLGEEILGDRLEDTLDYSLLNEIILSEMALSTHLIETVGLRILERAQAAMPRALAIELRIRKLHPPLRGQVGASVVSLQWQRPTGI